MAAAGGVALRGDGLEKLKLPPGAPRCWKPRYRPPLKLRRLVVDWRRDGRQGRLAALVWSDTRQLRARGRPRHLCHRSYRSASESEPLLPLAEAPDIPRSR